MRNATESRQCHRKGQNQKDENSPNIDSSRAIIPTLLPSLLDFLGDLLRDLGQGLVYLKALIHGSVFTITIKSGKECCSLVIFVVFGAPLVLELFLRSFLPFHLHRHGGRLSVCHWAEYCVAQIFHYPVNAISCETFGICQCLALQHLVLLGLLQKS